MTTTLDEIRQAIASRDAEARGRAMQALLNLVRKDAGVHQEALGIFMGALANEQAPWAAISAARGVTLIAGEKEGRRAWRVLLDHPQVEMVAAVAAVVDASHGLHLLQVLETRAEVAIQIPCVRALGRLKVAQAFDPIVQRLADRDVRPHAIEALADLGDARAVDHVKKYLTDKAEAWPEDNHGPMLRVRDLAKAAIEKLSGVAPKAPEKLMKAPAAGPTRLEPKRPASNTFVYLPAVAALVQVPWFAAVAFFGVIVTGGTKLSDVETQTLDLVAIVPALTGLILGGVALTRGRFGGVAQVAWFVVGVLFCGFAAFTFGWEYFHPAVENAPDASGLVIPIQ